MNNMGRGGNSELSHKRWRRILNFLAIFVLVFSFLSPAASAHEVNANAKQGPNQEARADRIAQLKELVDHQNNLLRNEPVLHASLQKVDPEAWVDVIVQFSEDPVALAKGTKELGGKALTAAEAKNIESMIVKQHKSFEQQLQKQKIAYKKGHTYKQVLNGVSLTVKGKDLQKLAQFDDVVRIDPDRKVYALQETTVNTNVGALMNDSNDFLNIPALWERGIDGEGVKVAVLDTGIDYHHPDLKDVYKGGWNFVSHDEDIYARDRADDDPYETTPEDRAPHAPESRFGSPFHTSHGTHVAGIIAAQGKNAYGVIGVAPKIELYAYRVLGAYGSGYTSDVIAGIEKAVEEKMDVINLSLGSSDTDENTPDAIAINNAVLAGVTAVVANGNSGPGKQTVGSPATAVTAISVGNTTLDEYHFQANIAFEAGDFSKELESVSVMALQSGQDLEEDFTGTFDVVAVPGYGDEEDYEGLDVAGKVVIVYGLGLAENIYEKIVIAKQQGAIGVILHSRGSEPHDFIFGDSVRLIPTFAINYYDAEEFREAIENTDEKVGKLTVRSYTKDVIVAGDKINDSSSRGPSTPNFDIKPDVVAPGTRILSTVPAYGKDYPDADYTDAYEHFTGTSMAAPQVAGMAALLLSANPNWTPFDVKVALSNTADLLDINDVFAQGAGRVNPVAAFDATALAYAKAESEMNGETFAHQKGTVTFGNVATSADSDVKVTREIVVKGLKDSANAYKVSVEKTKVPKNALSNATVSVDQSSFNLNAGGEVTLTVTLTVPAVSENPGGELQGYIHITNGHTKLSLPFAANFAGSATGPEVAFYFLRDMAISPNNDGILDTTELYLDVPQRETLMSIDLWDVTNPTGGPDKDGYIGTVAVGEDIGPGTANAIIDGTYFPYGGEKVDIPDGVYTVDYISYTNNEGGDLLAYDGPFIVKRTAPKVNLAEVDVEGGSATVTGNIDDQLLEYIEPVKENLGVELEVNRLLRTEYVLKDQQGNVVENSYVILENDGTFTTLLRGLNAGEYTFVLNVFDIAGNSATAETTFTVEEGAPEPPKEEEVTITLTHSPTEPTEGPVTISVAVESETEVVALKWLEGKKDVADFADAGHDIDLNEKAFAVDQNGDYTVYAKTASGAEAVESIKITNIIEAEQPFEITLSQTPEELTKDPVTIHVHVAEDIELVELKWLPGEKDVADFVDAGEAIDLDTKAFEVTENGTYTVYGKDSEEREAIARITVENIIDEDPEPTPDPAPITIELSASPEGETPGPVTITVHVDSEADLEALKWLPGKKDIADFVDAGYDIDFDQRSFEVSENGDYTVYARNVDGSEAVATITIKNIKDDDDKVPPKPIVIHLTHSPKEPTVGPVTIYVDVQSDSDLVALQWLPGEKDVADFADGGNDINLETKAFEVTENGVYTVYAKNKEGTEAVATYEIKNIVPPEEPPSEPPAGPGEPGEPGEPGDPGDEPGDDPGDKPGDKPGDQPADKPGVKPGDHELPSTSTNYWNIVLIGLALVTVAGVAFFLQRKLRSS